MRITRIRLTDFKRHAELDLELAPGLTIVRGPNEAGKSTIQEALELALFRKADSMARDVLAAQRWGTREPPHVQLGLEVDGAAITLSKRFAGARGEGVLSQAGEVLRDADLIRQRLATMTGVPTEAFFRSTASVGHGELADVAGDQPAIQDRLQKAISGADRGTGRAKQKLESAIHRYRTEGQKNPGLLKSARAEVAALESDLAIGEQALARLEADRAQWVEARERRMSLDAQLALQQAELEEARRAEQLTATRDEAQDRYDRLRRAAELVEKADAIRGAIPTELPLARLRSIVGRAGSLSLGLAELEAEPDLETLANVSLEPTPTPPRPLRWVALAGILVALAAAASIVLGGLSGAAVFTILALATVAALAQSVRMAFRRRQWALAQGLAHRAAEERRAADQERRDAFRRQRHEFEGLLSTLGVGRVEEAEAMLEASEARTEELAHIEGELRGLGVDERDLRRLEVARDQAANGCEQAKHALAGMEASWQDPVAARKAAQKRVEQTVPARDAARSEEDQAQGRVDANQVDAELVAGIAERLAAARERLAELERRVVVYESTLRAIESAERATLKTAARYLEEHMGPAIARITDGRYDQVVVDEKDLAFRVRVPETRELVDVGTLSQGTCDQLFLAARLGLVRLVTMERRPPLILDDPFVTFDAARADRALRLVRDVAGEQGFQVILLTTSDRFDALADGLVVLEGPAHVPAPSPVPASEPAAPATPDPGTADPATPDPAPVPIAAKAPPQARQAPTPEPLPLLRFAPDPRPNPDPGFLVAPPAEAVPEMGRDATEAGGDDARDPVSGLADPFRLGESRRAR